VHTGKKNGCEAAAAEQGARKQPSGVGTGKKRKIHSPTAVLDLRLDPLFEFEITVTAIIA
jgi:hypothetical protein